MTFTYIRTSDNPDTALSVSVGYLEERALVFLNSYQGDSMWTMHFTPTRALDLADALYHACDRHDITRRDRDDD